MKKVWFLLSNSYKNSKIKVKLFITLTLIMMITLVFVLLGLQYAFSLYDKLMYAKSSQVLIMSSNSIEEQLERVEEVSFKIATNPQIQRNLVELKGELSEYDLFRIEREVVELLAGYVGSEIYIQSIYLFDSKGRQYLAGSSSEPMREMEKYNSIQKASKREGGNFWVEGDGSNRFLTSARKIRSYQNLNFENIGNLLVRADLNKIVSGLPKPHGKVDGNIIISNGKHVFYSEKPLGGFKDFDFSIKNNQGYNIEKINSERYFINHIKSPYDSWTYWSIIPYDQIFAKITLTKYSIVLLFLLMFMVLISFGFKFSRRITTPIEDLVRAMKQVQKGDFKVVAQMNHSLIYEDEVGILYRNFKIMVERIDELIKEIYTKQLLIKETEFKALQAQINPHFLYNTLESINWQAKANQQHEISNMVESLGYILRHSINFKKSIITLENELEIVQNYITIQKYRFEERLDFHMDIPPELMECSIPKLTLQPIIENAIQHALEPSLEPCLIKIKAYEQNDTLFIRVEDNGPGIDLIFLKQVKEGKVQSRGNGIGLKNIDERIQLGFGDQYGLKIENMPDKGAVVTVVLPFQGRFLDGV